MSLQCCAGVCYHPAIGFEERAMCDLNVSALGDPRSFLSPLRPVGIRGDVRPSSAALICAFRWGLRIAAIVAAVLSCSGLQTAAQGFGASKKTITLERKLPAVVHLPGTAIDIRPAPSDQAKADVAQALSDVLLVTLQKCDARLHVDKNSPDVVIGYSITTFQTPPPTGFVRQETRYVNKRVVQVPVQYFKVIGELTIAYLAVDAHKKTLDADTITKKYAQDFQVGTNVAASPDEGVGSFVSKINPFNKGKKPEENMGPPNAVQLRQILVDGVVSQLALRLVNTNEKIEVMLSRGKPFDDANKLAEKGLWTRYLEAVETMTPLSDPAQDAYRLYNIGVADEALAYQTEDATAAHRFLNDAAINYGKSIAAKPDEKYFLDPQTRIETALAYYQKLKAGANTKGDLATASSASGDTQQTKAVSAEGESNGTRTAAVGGTGSPGNAGSRAKGPSGSAKNGSGVGAGAAPPGSKPDAGAAKQPLANEDVIRMAKAGVDEDSIVTAIQDAAKVNFDLSPDGLIALANAGVKGKIATAMRTRAKQAPRRASSPAPN
jgi:hypothetical protein